MTIQLIQSFIVLSRSRGSLSALKVDVDFARVEACSVCDFLKRVTIVNLLLEGLDQKFNGTGDEVVAVHRVRQGLEIGMDLDQFAPELHAK